MSLAPAVADAITHRQPDKFCRAILPAVSRTFALGIKVLSGHLGQAVLDAYLLCRIADTIEDSLETDAELKAGLFDDFLEAFDSASALGRFLQGVQSLQGNEAHLTLTLNTDLVLTHFSELPEHTQTIVRRWVTEMVVGMRKFVLRYPHGIRIQTVDEYKEYCYYVAGTVGYMLTDLWHAHTPSITAARYANLRERSREFAEALQTVNIVKDVAVDLESENSVYIPEALLTARGSSQRTILAPEFIAQNKKALTELIALAWHDLEIAQNYLLLIPRRASSIRLFCIFPLLLAYATLRDLNDSTAMLTPGESVKISRREVKRLLVAGMLVAGSNTGVRWLVRRTSKIHRLP